MNSQPRVGVTLLKIACVYLVAGLLLGMFMAIRQDFSLMSVHAHVALLGWVTMAIAALVYVVLPGCAATKLASVHFWLHNIGLPIMMSALTVGFLRGDAGTEPITALGSTLVIVALVAFTINVFRNAGAANILERESA